jgi:nitroreductase
MEIPYSRWYAAIGNRRSRRSFDPRLPMSDAALAELARVCNDFRPFPHARACLVTRPGTDIFRGIVGSYGKISGSAGFIAFIGDMRARSVQEEVGYTGEGIILEATALGIDTCWVGGFFKAQAVSSLVETGEGERVLAVTPFGRARSTESGSERLMTGFGITHRRLALKRLVSRSSDASLPDLASLPGWARAAVEAARMAPSAVNRQPWAFRVSGDSITVQLRTATPDLGVSKRLDCGIAMLHIELAALSQGYTGQWEFLDAPEVARFAVSRQPSAVSGQLSASSGQEERGARIRHSVQDDKEGGSG